MVVRHQTVPLGCHFILNLVSLSLNLCIIPKRFPKIFFKKWNQSDVLSHFIPKGSKRCAQKYENCFETVITKRENAGVERRACQRRIKQAPAVFCLASRGLMLM